MLEMSAFSAYKHLRYRKTETTRHKRVNSLFIERSASVHMLALVLETDISSI